MRLSESEKANPQDYFLQSGVDANGDPIYKDVNQEVTDYAPAKAFRKKVFDGTADIVVLADTVQIYWKGNLIAEAQLEGQVETSPGVWQGQLFSFADANIQKITEINTDEGPMSVTPFFRAFEVKDIPALGITNAVFGMDVHWAFKDTKLSFYLDTPGFNARIRWQARVKDSAIRQPESSPGTGDGTKGLYFSVKDYEGEVNHGSQADPESGWTQHWWTFEPNGKQIDAADARTPLERYEQSIGLLVDPYLRVDEQSTYIDIFMDGAKARFYWDRTGTSDVIEFFNSSDTEIAKCRSYIDVSSDIYYYNINGVMNIIENTPQRVRVVLFTNFRDSTTELDLTNSTSLTIYYTIYPDRIFANFIWVLSGSVTTRWPSTDYTGIFGVHPESLTNNTGIYENSGSEPATTSGDYMRTGDYVGLKSDELNATIIMLEDNTTAGMGLATKYDECDGAGVDPGDNTIFTSGVNQFAAVMILDFDEREAGDQIYDSTDRLAMGDQYKDLEIDLTEGGSRVFDDGSSQYLEYGGAVLNAAPMTLVGFFNSDDLTSQQSVINITDADSTHDIELFAAGHLAGDYVRIYVNGATTSVALSTTNGYSQNTWHHAAYVMAASNDHAVFIDGGGKATSSTNVGTFSGLDRTGIASKIVSGGRSAYMSGKIAHAAIWNVALTDEEVLRLANGALPTEIRPEALVAYWPLIDDDNDPIGGYNMTPYNSPTRSTTDYPDVFKPDKGIWEIQDIHPAIIDESGFQSDGAWHIIPDTNDEAKYTLDRTRIRPATVIHDWPFQYGSVDSPTSILLNHLKMDDNAANNILLAEVGPNGTWHLRSDGSARDTDNDSVAVDNFRGRALDQQDGTAYGELAVGSGTVHDNDFLKKGSVLIKLTPQFSWNDGATQFIFELYQGSDDMIGLYYLYTTDVFSLSVEWGTTITYSAGPAFTEDYSLKRPMVMLASWDSDKDFVALCIDGLVIDIDVNTGVPTSSHPSEFAIGSRYYNSSPGDYIIDEIKTFSEALLPYGAFFIGNGSGLLADIDNPHADLCFFWDCQEIGSGKARGGANLASSADVWQSGSPVLDTTDALVGTYCFDTNGINGGKVTESVVNSDLIDGSKGAVLIWVNPQSYDSSSRTFWSYIVSGSYRIQLLFDASDELQFQYVANGNSQAVNSGVSLTAGVWACVKATWDNEVSDKIHLYINNIEVGTPDNLTDAWSGTGGNIAIGGYFGASDDADVKIGRVFISNNPNTPEIWTAFGKPLHLPLVNLG